MGERALRAEQVDRTRERILEAVVRVLARDVAELSVQGVARESGVSRPTVYRYFSGKRAMLDAVAELYRRSLGLENWRPQSLEELLADIPATFARSAEMDDTLRAAAFSRLGDAGVRGGKRRQQRIEATKRVFAPHWKGMSADERRMAVNLAVVLCSTGTRRAFKTYLGIDAEEAAAHVTWAIRCILGPEAPPSRRRKRA